MVDDLSDISITIDVDVSDVTAARDDIEALIDALYRLEDAAATADVAVKQLQDNASTTAQEARDASE